MNCKEVKTGDLVVYSTRGICRVKGVEKQRFDREIKEYFVLSPLYDERSTYYVPVDFDSEKVHIKPALTASEAEALLEYAKTAEPLEWIANPNERKQSYDWTYKAKSREEKVRLIKALKLHEIRQKELGKQLYASDAKILSGCENIVADELAYVLSRPADEILSEIEKF